MNNYSVQHFGTEGKYVQLPNREFGCLLLEGVFITHDRANDRLSMQSNPRKYVFTHVTEAMSLS